MMNIPNIDLYSDVSGYEDAFQLDEKNVSNIVDDIQPLVEETLRGMREFQQSVVDAVAEINRLEERDRIAAAEAARKAAAAEEAAKQSAGNAQSAYAANGYNYTPAPSTPYGAALQDPSRN